MLTSTKTKLTKRRAIRALENEKDKHIEAKAKAAEGLARVNAQLRMLRRASS